MKTTTTTTTTEMPGVEAVTDNIIVEGQSPTTTDKPMLTFEGDYETIEKHKVSFSSDLRRERDLI